MMRAVGAAWSKDERSAIVESYLIVSRALNLDLIILEYEILNSA